MMVVDDHRLLSKPWHWCLPENTCVFGAVHSGGGEKLNIGWWSIEFGNRPLKVELMPCLLTTFCPGEQTALVAAVRMQKFPNEAEWTSEVDQTMKRNAFLKIGPSPNIWFPHWKCNLLSPRWLEGVGLLDCSNEPSNQTCGNCDRYLLYGMSPLITLLGFNGG